MAPNPRNPKKAIWQEDAATQSPDSATPPLHGEYGHNTIAHRQQTPLGSIAADTGSSYQSSSHRFQSLPQLDWATSPEDRFEIHQAYSNQPTGNRDNQTGPPTSHDGKSESTSKRKAETSASAPKPAKTRRVSNRQVAGAESTQKTNTTGDSSSIQGHVFHIKPSMSEPARGKAPRGESKRGKSAKGKTSKSTKAPDGGGDDDPSVETDSDTESSKGDQEPLREMWPIAKKLAHDSMPCGLGHFRDLPHLLCFRVGTLCSGTDAPIHIMNLLFKMLKNEDGKKILNYINCFGCEIEPFKQGFLIRNSKPELLFKDAHDFARGEAERARLVTGAEERIPDVDFFIAGTSCVDFSSLSTNKIRAYSGLQKSLHEWEALKEEHDDRLSYEHLSDVSWNEAIKAMTEKTDTKNTSTKTFAAAMNYAKWRQPKILIFENVDSAPWESLLASGFMQLMGYTAAVHRLDTKHYHLPQTRVRKYMVAFSHRAFTLEGAQALCKVFNETLPHLQHHHKNSVLDFVLPPHSLELHKARNEMELAAQSVREREVNWSFSKSRHTAFRREHDVPDLRLWICWLENAISNAPAKMWKAWENRQPCRVSDVLDGIYLVVLFGRISVHGFYDLRFKAQILDCSQNIERIPLTIQFGRTGCLTPNAIPLLTLDARPLTGHESLRLQGLPVEDLDMSVETQAQLQDLAGNAMTTTVVGAVILAALSAIARVDREEGFNWLGIMFVMDDFEAEGNVPNSFHCSMLNITHKPQELLHLKLHAQIVPQQGVVREILALGQRARRRCVCQHILPYSSIELHVCEACGESFCKSCKGNPEHALVKSPETLETLNSLPYAEAECEFRKRFPPVLWMRCETGPYVEKLSHALMRSTYDHLQRRALAEAIIEGLCNSTYQLRFVEITDAVRLEYTADSTFILRVMVEKEEIVWYLHLNQFSSAGKKLAKALATRQPIARAVLGPEELNQFPGAGSWEFWIRHEVSFSLELRVQDTQGLHLEEVGDLGILPDQAQRPIKQLQGSDWTFNPKCGFPENAMWKYDGPHGKLFLFKDVNPIGKARNDAFVITPISREMGRTPYREIRPWLLRMRRAYQIHRRFKEVLVEEKPFLIGKGDKLSAPCVIGGWWESFEKHGIRIEAFPNMEYEGVQAIPKGAPTTIRRVGDESQAAEYLLCDKYHSLLTTSLPILGKVQESTEVIETLKTLDLTNQLDLAELTRVTKAPLSAVEMGLVGTGRRFTMIQEEVVLSSECAQCAPKIPEVFYVKSAAEKGMGSRATGPVVARHATVDQENYQKDLRTKPALLRIDHNVTTNFDPFGLKKAGVPYVDIRVVANGHAFAQQARAYLPQHPAQYGDSVETVGSLAMEVGVIETPRVAFPPPNISAPRKARLGDIRQTPVFQSELKLFPEQLDSLHWMLERESLTELKHFIEVEVVEIYHEKLHMRVHAEAHRRIIRRGRIVADDVGFGKTAVCLGLIDLQHETDRTEFMKMREANVHLEGLVHLHATLVIVPNQLTQQWASEARRFLESDRYAIIIIQSFSELQKLPVADLRQADIIICSNKAFQDNKYHAELSRYCSTNGLDKIRTQPKVYSAWYKQLHNILGQVLGDVRQIVEQADKATTWQQRDTLRQKLNQIRETQREIDQLKEKRDKIDDNENLLSFAPPGPQSADVKPGKKAVNDWEPLLLFEMFSYARIIWDEFPYENIPVAEFVTNCATTSKWMLSGTPPMDTLGDICRIARLFNVHVARPLPLIKGRQPEICEHEPLGPHSDLESSSLFQARSSPRLLVQRHEHGERFVRTFIRRNERTTNVTKYEKPVVLSMSKISFMFYIELQLELRSRQYNANNVGAESRRRLMSRVDWKGKDSGHDRSVEALIIRASASPEDVLRQSGLTGCSDLDAAKALLAATKDEIRGIEDRGRELLGKAIFLAYRLTFITLSDTRDETDGQEERQLSYYQTLADMVDNVHQAKISNYQSWDAFESAIRMLFWSEPMLETLVNYRDLPLDMLKSVLTHTFDSMKIGEEPVQLTPPISKKLAEIKEKTAEAEAVKKKQMPKETSIKNEEVTEEEETKVNKEDKATKNLRLKLEFFERFRHWLTKTPLHSRRWFLYDEVADLDSAEEELLRLEWSYKVPWENDYNASAGVQPHMVVPISRLLEPPSPTPNTVGFDLDHLKELDNIRRTRLANMETPSPEEFAAMTRELVDYKDTKMFWEAECNRRGLVAKSTDRKETLIARVAADRAKTATDKDYVSPESCGISLTTFPQQGKKRIRGGNMEVIFDGLMQTIDDFTTIHERSIVAHSRRNLQQVIVNILEDTWVCHDPACTKSYEAHYVSLLCGHVLCGHPDERQVCGVDYCRCQVENVCIPLSKIRRVERVMTASSLSGAIAQDPDSYLEPSATYKGSTKGPKARAVVNLIKRIKPSDSVVVFVQNEAIQDDVYTELAAAKVSHVRLAMLSQNEASSLEQFKEGKYQVLVQTVSSEQAAGSNLHNANHVIFVSPLESRKQREWDDQVKQAMGRCVRFRQSKTVYVYHMVMEETIEVDILEWRLKRDILVTDGQAVARFSDCETKDFVERYETGAKPEELGPGESRAFSILPRDDVQSLMGDDYLSLASIRALRTFDDSLFDKAEKAAEAKETEEPAKKPAKKDDGGPGSTYLLDQVCDPDDVSQDDVEMEDIYNA